MIHADPNVLIATGDAEQAVREPVVVDEAEFRRALEDERWREFCLRADEYVAATTRRAPRPNEGVGWDS